MELEIGDNVLCTVERVDGTLVFVKVHAENKETDGTIVTSEVAPGRIRNLRDYVVPKKKVVCKVLRISGTGNVELSLRRVNTKERKEVMERYKQERAYLSILKKILGDRTDEIVKKIQKEENIVDFFQNVNENEKKLEKLVGKDSEKILEILRAEKQKKAILKKEIILKSTLPNGIAIIKNVLGGIKEGEIKYVSAGKYFIKTESDDIKKADNKLKGILYEIEKKAKENKIEFSIKEK